MNSLKSLFLCLFLLISIVWIVNYEDQTRVYVLDPLKLLESKSNFSHRSTRITHAPIFISGDEDFITQVTAEYWPGEGTIANPFIIEGYTISAAEGPLISISDTIFYFNIRNNLLNGSNAATEGIHFSNVHHGTIENNIICNNAAIDGGIVFEFSSSYNLIINNSIFGNQMGMNIRGQHNRIINNSVYQNGMAIWLNTDTFNSTVVGNTIYNNTGSGIQLEQSHSNFICKNTIYGSKVNGIDFIHSLGNVIENNTISNTVLGISLWESSQNNVSSNLVFNNMGGISLYYSTDNSFWNNTAQENHNLGVDLEMSSHNNTFFTNKILKNGIVGGILFD
ncbi:MAG: nitrous oxide reductase family maturation protein NosD, partial [Promethearchaeota archaeon]